MAVFANPLDQGANVLHTTQPDAKRAVSMHSGLPRCVDCGFAIVVVPKQRRDLSKWIYRAPNAYAEAHASNDSPVLHLGFLPADGESQASQPEAATKKRGGRKRGPKPGCPRTVWAICVAGRTSGSQRGYSAKQAG